MGIFKKTAFFLLSLVFAVSSLGLVGPGARALDDPGINAEAIMLVETETGKVFYSKNADMQLNPASTTKLMTALLAVEAIDAGLVALDDMVTVHSDSYFDVSYDASIQDLRYGEEISLRDLLHCVVTSSACEACNVLGRFISGDVTTFIEQMNSRAAALGCKGTHFVNTHGLSAENHYTTAADLYLIYSECMKHDVFREINAVSRYKVPETNKKPERTLVTTNKLMVEDSEYYYEHCTGGKTGHTSSAGYCLVSSADNGAMSLISVVLGCRETNPDGSENKFIHMTESKKLFKWGFSNFSYRPVITRSKLVKEVPVAMGDGADSVVAVPAEDISALVANDLTDADLDLEITIYSDRDREPLIAPISKGDVLGEMDVYHEGELLGSTSLVANTGVAVSKTEYIENEIREAIGSKYVKIAAIVLGVLILAYIVLVIRYNIIRAHKRKMARRRAEREAALRRRPTTGKSFEEIEYIHKMSEENDRT